MFNALYVTNTFKQADWFLKDLFSTVKEGYYNRKDMCLTIRGMTVWGVSVEFMQTFNPRAFDYLVDDVDRWAIARDSVEKASSALDVAKMKLSEYGKIISKEELTELVKKEVGMKNET
jgi:hypothetical protein